MFSEKPIFDSCRKIRIVVGQKISIPINTWHCPTVKLKTLNSSISASIEIFWWKVPKRYFMKVCFLDLNADGRKILHLKKVLPSRDVLPQFLAELAGGFFNLGLNGSLRFRIFSVVSTKLKQLVSKDNLIGQTRIPLYQVSQMIPWRFPSATSKL